MPGIGQPICVVRRIRSVGRVSLKDSQRLKIVVVQLLRYVALPAGFLRMYVPHRACHVW